MRWPLEASGCLRGRGAPRAPRPRGRRMGPEGPGALAISPTAFLPFERATASYGKHLYPPRRASPRWGHTRNAIANAIDRSAGASGTAPPAQSSGRKCKQRAAANVADSPGNGGRMPPQAQPTARTRRRNAAASATADQTIPAARHSQRNRTTGEKRMLALAPAQPDGWKIVAEHRRQRNRLTGKAGAAPTPAQPIEQQKTCNASSPARPRYRRTQATRTAGAPARP